MTMHFSWFSRDAATRLGRLFARGRRAIADWLRATATPPRLEPPRLLPYL